MFYPNEIRGLSQPGQRRYAWHELEEYLPSGGMWAAASAGMRPAYIELSAALMADPPRFYKACLRVLDRWPKSVSQALTTPGLNQKAWLGHAACYLETGSVEETTRLGWHQLDEAEQFAANDAAQHAIYEWRKRSAPVADQLDLFGEDPSA